MPAPIEEKTPPTAPANLLDEPFEKCWREHAPLVDAAMQLGTREAWRHVSMMVFACGALFGSNHTNPVSHGPADGPEENSDEANVDRERSR